MSVTKLHQYVLAFVLTAVLPQIPLSAQSASFDNLLEGVYSGPIVERFPLIPDSVGFDSYRNCARELYDGRCAESTPPILAEKFPHAAKLPAECRISVAGLQN